MIYKLIGWYLKKQRIKRGLTLREFCIWQRYDASTISRLERGYYFGVAPEYEYFYRSHRLVNGEWVKIADISNDIKVAGFSDEKSK